VEDEGTQSASQKKALGFAYSEQFSFVNLYQKVCNLRFIGVLLINPTSLRTDSVAHIVQKR
jgi:hypothetical protein